MHPFVPAWISNLQNIRKHHPQKQICIPWKRIYEVVRHYDLPKCMFDFDKALLSSKSLPEFYGIERLEDGIAYRLLGGTTRLKLLYPVPASETSKLYEYNIEPTIVSLQALKALVEHAPKKLSTPLPIHVWLNVGYRTTGIATSEELHAVMMLMQTSSHTVFCQAIGTKFPYEKDIATFSDFYKYTPASIKSRILKSHSWHTPCAIRFNELVAPYRDQQSVPVLLHNATSFEVYAGAVDPSTSLITVGNLFYYGFKSKVYKWPLELQQLTSLPVGHCLSNDCKPLSQPLQIATLFSRIPTANIFSKNKKTLLTILEEDLNYGKVVVEIKGSSPTSNAYMAERKFF